MKPRKTSSTLRRYLLALGLLGIAFVLSLLAEPLLRGQHPYLLFIPVVLIAAWYGRVGPALVVLAGGYVLADFFFSTPLYTLGPFTAEALVSILTYASITLVGILLVEAVHRARDRQEQLRAHADELERRVAERTASLEASFKSLQGVLYHVAHDLRAPLRAMHGFTHLLLQQRGGPLTSTGEDYAQRIHAAAELMDKKISDLLEFGRLGHQRFLMEKVDLSQVVEQVLAGLADKITEREAEVRIDKPLPAVRGDAQVLAQALGNVLKNALTFMATGTMPRIHIWSEQHQGKVRLCIRDNGIGIAPEYHEKIFGLFEQLNESGGFPGTGMGLAIAKQGIESIGGRIGVQSEPRHGSLFWIELSSAGADPHRLEAAA